MLEIDISSLLSTFNNLKSNYDSLEESQMNLFNNLSAIVNTDWKDGNSFTFDKQIYNEKLETERFRLNIWSKISVVEYIYNQYSTLAKKIKINLGMKSKILSSVDICISTLTSINNEFDLIDTSFYYPELVTIKEKKRKCKSLKTSLESIKDDINTIYSKIEEIENDIKAKIAEIEDFITVSFGYTPSSNNYEVLNGALLRYDLFEVDKSKAEFYIEEENKNYISIYNNALKLSSGYKSTNSSKYTDTFTNYKNCYEKIYGKRKGYIDILNQVPVTYNIAVTNEKEIFKGDVSNG